MLRCPSLRGTKAFHHHPCHCENTTSYFHPIYILKLQGKSILTGKLKTYNILNILQC